MKTYHKNLEILNNQIKHNDVEFDIINEFSKISEEEAENIVSEIMGINNQTKENAERLNYLKIFQEVGLYGTSKIESLNKFEIAKLLKYSEAKRQNLASECRNKALYSGNFDYPKEFENDWIGYWKSTNTEYLEVERIDSIIAEYKNPIKRKKEIKITYPAIAYFCQLAKKNIFPDIQIMDNKLFCIMVCEKYNLKYTDNVRQEYGKSHSDKTKKKTENLIFPTIPQADLAKIIEPQKMYHIFLKDTQ